MGKSSQVFTPSLPAPSSDYFASFEKHFVYQGKGSGYLELEKIPEWVLLFKTRALILLHK